jgi:phage gp29-like protein
MVVPHKLKTYDPRSLTFKLNDKMQLEGVVQKQKSGQDIFIPADKIMIYTHEKEFGDYYGVSALRAAYKPWIIKEFLQKFWNIALERYGSPFMSMGIPQGASLASAMSLMDQLKHKTGIPLPDGYELEIHNLANTGMSFKDAIEYQDKMIARAMLIPDTLFANNDTGAYALSKTHAAFFLLRLNGIGQEIGDMITKYLIKPMVQYNFGDVQEMPNFKFNDVADDDMTQLLNIVKEMLAGGVIAPSEDWIRERLGLPPADEETQAWLDQKKQASVDAMNNLQQAGTPGQKQDPPAEPGKKNPDVKVNAKPEDKAAAKKDGQVQKNSEEDLDDYLNSMRSSVRGILKLGIGE